MDHSVVFINSLSYHFFKIYVDLKFAFGHAASKEDLIPPVPILTRYSKESGIKAFVKKELFDPRLPDERRSTEISVLTTPTLCVQLNTLYVSSCFTFSLCLEIWIFFFAWHNG